MKVTQMLPELLAGLSPFLGSSFGISFHTYVTMYCGHEVSSLVRVGLI